MSGFQGFSYTTLPDSNLTVNYAVWANSGSDWAQEIEDTLGVSGFKTAVAPASPNYNPDAKYVYFYSVDSNGASTSLLYLDKFEVPVQLVDDVAGYVDSFLFMYNNSPVPGYYGQTVGNNPSLLSFTGDGSALEPSASIVGSVASFTWTGFNTNSPTWSSVFFVASDTEPMMGNALLEGTYGDEVQRQGFALVPVAATPEPSSLVLMLAAFAGAACVGFRWRRKASAVPAV